MIVAQESTLALIDKLLQRDPFGIEAAEKRALYSSALSSLTQFHYERSAEYRHVLDLFGYRPARTLAIEEIPFIPVRLFKEFKLSSVPDSEIARMMTSSGTTGQQVSRIHLDKTTAANQTKVLVRIMSSFLGDRRLPFLVIDSPAVLKDRTLFSARGAGILGFAMLGYDLSYALNEQYQIDYERLEAFLEKHRGRRLLVFGFTFVVWEHFCQALKKVGRTFQVDGILIHGGGWKKLESRAVDKAVFRQAVAEVSGILTICNYYGMIEQTGSIFVECEYGALHASAFSDVIVRDPITFELLPPGEVGLLQLVSLLPTSYPGHSILTEDMGRIVRLDGCPCGRKGTCLEVYGRIKNAEVRGCSDVYASQS
jgi:phenylacetate-coenzyme A ligase PaaK-like adenylate-forming protein